MAFKNGISKQIPLLQIAVLFSLYFTTILLPSTVLSSSIPSNFLVLVLFWSFVIMPLCTIQARPLAPKHLHYGTLRPSPAGGDQLSTELAEALLEDLDLFGIKKEGPSDGGEGH
uniref:Uncharacterized protein n=1 Tax=Manihot esculenta TaxID=3983 RepID=A0A199UCD6_MANES